MGHVLQRVGGDAGIKRLPRRTRSGGASGAAVREAFGAMRIGALAARRPYAAVNGAKLVFVRSITHTPAEERAKRLAVQVRGEVREAFAEGHAARPHGSICSSIAICSSDKSAISECRQPVLRMMWIASARDGCRAPETISLA